MEKFIAQQDEICGECGCDISKGSWIFTDGSDVRCLDCYDKDEFGETYG